MEQIFEGHIIGTEGNADNLVKLSNGETLENKVYIEAMCTDYDDKTEALIFAFGKNKGVLPKENLTFTEQPKKSQYLINKVVGFYVTGRQIEEDGTVTYTLDRCAVQEDYFKSVLVNLKVTDILKGVVVGITVSTAFVDVGYGILTVVHNVNASMIRIADMHNFFTVGEEIYVIVKQVPTLENKFLFVSHKELLGTWNQNVVGLSRNDVVDGIISTIHNYGIFVAITGNLVALADIPTEDKNAYAVGDSVRIVIRHIAPTTSKIKAQVVGYSAKPVDLPKVYHLDYPYAEKGNVWVYNEDNANTEKQSKTVFGLPESEAVN